MTPETAITLGFLTFGLALAGAMSWLERRPRTDFNPRLIPTTPVMFIGALIAVFALLHLATLAGLKPGPP